jgi:hypothetical protein
MRAYTRKLTLEQVLENWDLKKPTVDVSAESPRRKNCLAPKKTCLAWFLGNEGWYVRSVFV